MKFAHIKSTFFIKPLLVVIFLSDLLFLCRSSCPGFIEMRYMLIPEIYAYKRSCFYPAELELAQGYIKVISRLSFKWLFMVHVVKTFDHVILEFQQYVQNLNEKAHF